MSDEIQAITRAVHAFICRYCAENGLPPSQREIGAACYLSQPGVIRHLDRLAKQGKIERILGKSRGIRLLDEANDQG
jgi:SOS-response transcriptional repressor LexA